MHWTNASRAPQPAVTRSTRALLPRPASPSTNTSCRWPCLAAARAAGNSPSAAARPTRASAAVPAPLLSAEGGRKAHDVLERRFVDVAVAPNAIQQRFLGDQFARLAHEGAYHLARARRAPPQLLTPG